MEHAGSKSKENPDFYLRMIKTGPGLEKDKHISELMHTQFIQIA